jgi:hypothetical protein
MMAGQQGCQKVYFKTENPKLGKFWWVLDIGKCFKFIAMLNILWTSGISNDTFLVHFLRFWYHVPTKIWQPC